MCVPGGPFRPGGAQLLVTPRLAGDDVADYFTIGGHFEPWQGGNVGQRVITHRLFVLRYIDSVLWSRAVEDGRVSLTE